MDQDNSLAASVARSVAARGGDVDASDQAAVDLAMRYAAQIDAGVEAGGQAATKALYLGPHLLKALDALGCTPAGRGVVGPAAAPGPGRSTPQSRLAAFNRRGGA